MESHRNSEVIWLLRNLKPDVKTSADFRRDNRGPFGGSSTSLAARCWPWTEFGARRSTTRTRNSLQNFIRAADERLDDDLRRLDEGDVEEGGAARVRKISPRRSRRSARSATATG
jgi:hypothetical protein